MILLGLFVNEIYSSTIHHTTFYTIISVLLLLALNFKFSTYHTFTMWKMKSWFVKLNQYLYLSIYWKSKCTIEPFELFRCCSCMEGSWIQGKWDLFRSIIHDIVDNPFFEWTILLLIFASRWLLFSSFRIIRCFCFSLSLCFEDINLQDNEELKFILKIVNLVFAVLFTVEMFLKWIAFGLYRYFSSVWTCLDFVIVIVSPALRR